MKNSWELYDEADLLHIEKMSNAYRTFLDNGKTERECVKQIREISEKLGFQDLKERVKDRTPLKPGEKIAAYHMGKAAALFVVGKETMESGVNYIGAHIDSPRIDLKPNPLYEERDLAYFDTHYYGGVKKYQWVTLPLAIHGVVALKDGTTVDVVIGEKEEEPVFCITDLLVHLSQDQMTKNAAKVIEGEDLDILIGSRPIKDEDKDVKEPVKANVLKLLKERYGITEDDFLSAELECVPAGKARELGLDAGMLLAYGHDDRCCAFSTLYAMQQLIEENSNVIPERTCVAFFADKEEIGSVGATGSHSRFYENVLAELCALDQKVVGQPGMLELAIRRSLQNTCALSADVSSAFDPLYAGAFAKNNAAKAGYGIALIKYTGARGKSGANDANAEYIGRIRRIFEQKKVNFQMAELGKVDLGGGGTIAYIIAESGAEVIDCGIPVMNMHAPWEAISKADLYEAYKAYQTFFKDMSHT